MPQKTSFTLTVAISALLGLLVRSWRLDWQPLWWDEGYSAYYATETLGRMVWLTAHDIHPPLYYGLLHGWLVGFQSVQPAVLRLFSVLLGVASLPLLGWLARLLFPHQPRRWLLASWLLLINPLHLFYSQEVRMYALALTLGLISTACLWYAATAAAPQAQRLAWAGYVISSSLALYTLYYLAFLLLAHLLWLLGSWRRYPQRWLQFVGMYALIALLYAPWVVYAGRDLVNYVLTDKVPADADQPLGLFAYLGRHLLAFTAGQIVPTAGPLRYLLWSGVVGLGLLLLTSVSATLPRPRRAALPIPPSPSALLWACLLIPTGVALLINLRLPFFPTGGERLLLFVLPYFLLLISAGIDLQWGVGRLALGGMTVSAALGLWLFYTTPRYVADDYRPVIRQIVQQGQTGDMLLALFPWQVGYWRVYATSNACQLDRVHCGRLRGLDPHQALTVTLASERALTWGAPLQALIDQTLAQGALWLITPMNLGSTLPATLEAYLRQAEVIALTERWVSSSTRLSAWRRMSRPALAARMVDFGPVQLTGVGLAPDRVASANQPINVVLQWQVQGPTEALGVTLRLQDAAGRLWTSRDYQPLGSQRVNAAGQAVVDQAGLIIPAGLPPATYQVLAGVTISGTERLLPPQHGGAASRPLVELGRITVTQPAAPLPAFQLPIQKLAGSAPTAPILGYAGNLADTILLAGEPVDLTLFLQTRQTFPNDQQIYVSLLDRQGAGVVGWEGWSPAGWRSSQWPLGALVQAPVTFDTPATLPTGEYQLIAGLLDPATGRKSPATFLDQVRIRQRTATFAAPAIPQPLSAPVRFGTHIDLLGYALDRQADHWQLALYWQVQQTLLPPHHIFVHLDDADGRTLAQADGVPLTAAGPAPSGSWQPGEYVVTTHRVELPAGYEPSTQRGAHLQVGLYNPLQGSRLPATKAGEAVGDAVAIE